MFQVPGLSDAVNSDVPTMHVSKLDSPTPSRGVGAPTTSADVMSDPTPGRVEVL
jgi:hypothetical protein